MRIRIASLVLVSYLVPAWAQEDLGFEALENEAPGGWRLNGEEVSADTATFTEGETSLRIRSSELPARAGAVTGIASQTLRRAQFRADRLRLTGDIKTHRVEGFAGIWLRIEGPQGFLYMDDMRGRPVSGTEEWRRYEIDLTIPPETTQAMFGTHLSGKGTAWFDNLELESYSSQSQPPPSEGVAAYMDEVLDIMQEHSIVAGSSRGMISAKAR